jgi:hypothetical protein
LWRLKNKRCFFCIDIYTHSPFYVCVYLWPFHFLNRSSFHRKGFTSNRLTILVVLPDFVSFSSSFQVCMCVCGGDFSNPIINDVLFIKFPFNNSLFSHQIIVCFFLTVYVKIISDQTIYVYNNDILTLDNQGKSTNNNSFNVE